MVKLRKDSFDRKISWDFLGGEISELNEQFEKLGLVTYETDENGEEHCIYHPVEHMNPNMKFYVRGDLVTVKNFNNLFFWHPLFDFLQYVYRNSEGSRRYKKSAYISDYFFNTKYNS